jgi:hypothetical protein
MVKGEPKRNTFFIIYCIFTIAVIGYSSHDILENLPSTNSVAYSNWLAKFEQHLWNDEEAESLAPFPILKVTINSQQFLCMADKTNISEQRNLLGRLLRLAEQTKIIGNDFSVESDKSYYHPEKNNIIIIEIEKNETVLFKGRTFTASKGFSSIVGTFASLVMQKCKSVSV